MQIWPYKMDFLEAVSENSELLARPLFPLVATAAIREQQPTWRDDEPPRTRGFQCRAEPEGSGQSLTLVGRRGPRGYLLTREQLVLL